MKKNTRKSEEKKLYIGWISLGVGIIVILMWFLTYFLLRGRGAEVRGTFGDMFGSVNAIYSGLAFAGIIITIYLQSHELKLQRNELKETRREFEKQNETLTKQQFENTFFQMLLMLQTNIRSITTPLNNEIVSGNEIFTSFRSDIKGRIDYELRDRVKKGDENLEFEEKFKFEKSNFSISDLAAVFEIKYPFYENLLSNYFSTLYVILKFVDDSQMIDKNFYTSIITSQFSRDELYIVFLKTISLLEENTMRKLIDKYNIVEGLDLKLLINRDIFLNYIMIKNHKDFLTIH